MKKNLAKVLGIEELPLAPAKVESCEGRVISIKQIAFEQELQDHRYATSVALESIINAQQLLGVVEQNSSTDKTTYELLKVAVEQLKERTGVKTKGVSLEGLDKTNYKMESIQDVKDFIKRTWEAIKRAFSAMVQKIKDFFKWLFSRDKKIQEEEEQTLNEADNFDNAVEKAILLGYEKTQEPFKDGDTYDKKYSEKVNKYLGWDSSVAKHSGYSNQLKLHINKLTEFLSKISFTPKEIEENINVFYEKSKSNFSAQDELITEIKNGLNVTIRAVRNNNIYSIDIDLLNSQHVKVYPFDTRAYVSIFKASTFLIEPSAKLIERSKKQIDVCQEELENSNKLIDFLSKRTLEITESGSVEEQKLLGEIKETQKEWEFRIAAVQSIASVLSKFHIYLQELHLAILLYVRETINLSVKGYIKYAKTVKADIDVDEFMRNIYQT